MQNDARPIVFGAAYSVYVRAVRLTLEEKGVAYGLVPIDVFATGGPPADYLARHPFGRIPAFEHNGFRLYESGAIERYIDEAFDGPPLQPGEPCQRARMNQVIGILDAYAYRALVWDIYVERIGKPREGRTTDEERIGQAIAFAKTCLVALENLMATGPWFAGPKLSLADLHAAPMFDYFRRAPEGENLLAERRRLSAWWATLTQRRSMSMTEV